MKKLILATALAASVGLVIATGPANAATRTAAAVPSSSPFSYTDTDGGTCGNTWAYDLGTRVFTQPAHDPAGNYAIVEKFTQGHFATIKGMSPGACDPASRANDGHLVRDGLSGTFNGNEDLFIQGGTFAADDGSCNGSDDPCTTASYVAYHYGTDATATITEYKFTYKASGSLAPKQWVENSTDGNTETDTGDIATS